MIRTIIAAVLAAILASGLMAGAARAETRIEVGRLSCTVDPGIGLVFVSSKDMTCRFLRQGHRTEIYEGTITKVGLDIGITERTQIEWLVFSGSDVRVGPRSLAGSYVGGSGEATIGVGLGSNWLIGGSRRGFALQPFSIQAQTGLNLSLALAGLTLY
ncbi:DUF992 domain-containing protein [Arsenicitalea aurantiaca]|uniref:DUF992 domain-containing protein n=1 Tax=Arsenicitalea aurantiaca TaxID=1783274 RepID=A0A433XKS4_9HYPH|nr:DUF992 domain-containing protein [Arsenicitalea aurantiaca]RUT34624.1 DUF992 domain-containing protein [Arsenicitalea aurantiaca]